LFTAYIGSGAQDANFVYIAELDRKFIINNHLKVMETERNLDIHLSMLAGYGVPVEADYKNLQTALELQVYWVSHFLKCVFAEVERSPIQQSELGHLKLSVEKLCEKCRKDISSDT